MESFPILETKCTYLRHPTDTDKKCIRNLWKSAQVREFLGGVVPDGSIDDKISLLSEHWNQYGFGLCAVIDKDTDRAIGVCGLHHSDDGVELSYMFFPESWGKGLAKESALASLDYGFTQLELKKIIGITQKANRSSCRLLENIGMRCIDCFERFGAVQCLYELEGSDWQGNKGKALVNEID